MSGPEGKGTSLPVYDYDGNVLLTLWRVPFHDREKFQPQNLHDCGARVDKRRRCGNPECKTLLEAVEVTDAERMIGEQALSKDPAERQQQVAAMEERTRVMDMALTQAKEQIPMKVVCGSCSADVDDSVTSEFYCEACTNFTASARLGFARREGGDILLTNEQVNELQNLRLSRGIYMLGTVPHGYYFPEWETNETFALQPRGVMGKGLYTALSMLKTGLLVWYCSANEQASTTLKNEWVAILRVNKDGKFMLTTLRCRDDLLVQNLDGPVGFTPTVQNFVNLLLAKQMPSDDLDGLRLETPARRWLRNTLHDQSIPTLVPRPSLDAPIDFTTLTKQLVESALAEEEALKQQEQEQATPSE